MNLYMCFSHQCINASQFLSALLDRKQLLSINVVQKQMEQNLQTDLTDLPLQSPTVNLVVTGDWQGAGGVGWGGVFQRRDLYVDWFFFKMVNTKEVVLASIFTGCCSQLDAF